MCLHSHRVGRRRRRNALIARFFRVHLALLGARGSRASLVWYINRHSRLLYTIIPFRRLRSLTVTVTATLTATSHSLSPFVSCNGTNSKITSSVFDDACEFYEDAKAQLLQTTCTLLHGDLKFPNLFWDNSVNCGEPILSIGGTPDLDKESKILFFSSSKVAMSPISNSSLSR